MSTSSGLETAHHRTEPRYLSQDDPMVHSPGDRQPSELPPFAALPPLAGLAALAALADLLVHRVALPSLHPTLGHVSLLAIARWGGFATNLAAIAGLVALVSGLRELLDRPGVVHPRRRMTIGFFSFVVVTLLTAAAVLPPHYMNRQIVLVGMGAANVLVVAVMVSVFRHSPRWGERLIALALATVAAATVSAQLIELSLGRGPLTSPGSYHRWAQGFGEISHLVVLVALTAFLLPTLHEPRGRLRLVTGGGIAGMAAAGLLLARAYYPADYPLVFYHAQRMVLLLEHSWLYVLPLAAAVGAGTAALLSPHTAHKQASVGLWLLLAAGYAPRTPGRLLMLCLAAVLIARAVLHWAAQRPRQPTADPEGKLEPAESP